MKIFCIGRNYAKHALELNNAVPTQPLVFMKPQTALVRNNQAVYCPEFTQDLHHEVELVLKIAKNGKHINEKFAMDYVSEISVGIDFTARDLQKQLKEKGHPWEIAKAFDGSAPVGQFIKADTITDWEAMTIELDVNGETRQKGCLKNLIFPIPTLINYISTYFTLQTGDLIYTGTPEGVGAVQIGDRLVARLNGEELLNFEVK